MLTINTKESFMKKNFFDKIDEKYLFIMVMINIILIFSLNCFNKKHLINGSFICLVNVTLITTAMIISFIIQTIREKRIEKQRQIRIQEATIE